MQLPRRDDGPCVDPQHPLDCLDTGGRRERRHPGRCLPNGGSDSLQAMAFVPGCEVFCGIALDNGETGPVGKRIYDDPAAAQSDSNEAVTEARPQEVEAAQCRVACEDNNSRHCRRGRRRRGACRRRHWMIPFARSGVESRSMASVQNRVAFACSEQRGSGVRCRRP